MINQCKNLEIPIIEEIPNNIEKDFDQILDSIFGFSFKGNIRPPFDRVIDVRNYQNLKLIYFQRISESNLPITSVDIPSGWDVEQGPKEGCIRDPDVLISLTAPKLCSKYFKGSRHFIGGRFVPTEMKKELNLPNYKNNENILEL